MQIATLKHSEKIIIWLHRTDRTQLWLAEQLGQTRQSVAGKIKGNHFSDTDLKHIKSLGCPLE
jgi:hypothetical protein